MEAFFFGRRTVMFAFLAGWVCSWLVTKMKPHNLIEFP